MWSRREIPISIAMNIQTSYQVQSLTPASGDAHSPVPCDLFGWVFTTYFCCEKSRKPTKGLQHIHSFTERKCFFIVIFNSSSDSAFISCEVLHFPKITRLPLVKGCITLILSFPKNSSFFFPPPLLSHTSVGPRDNTPTLAVPCLTSPAIMVCTPMALLCGLLFSARSKQRARELWLQVEKGSNGGAKMLPSHGSQKSSSCPLDWGNCTPKIELGSSDWIWGKIDLSLHSQQERKIELDSEQEKNHTPTYGDGISTRKGRHHRQWESSSSSINGIWVVFLRVLNIKTTFCKKKGPHKNM